MKILVTGSSGFIGRNVTETAGRYHEVISASRDEEESMGSNYRIDLLNVSEVGGLIKKIMPDAIINCAGIVENSDKASLNEAITMNLLEGVKKYHRAIGKVVILGSAAEYGIVRPEEVPVNEDVPLNPNTQYGEAKVRETSKALEFRRENEVPVVIARIFNPIGSGMNERMLIPNLLKQIKEINEGSRKALTVSRLDSRRDYIDVKDVAEALVILASKYTKEQVYNVGSGKSNTNESLVKAIIESSGLDIEIPIEETSETPEPQLATHADISRIKTEFGWKPKLSLLESIEAIKNDESK